jgi:asparagine synthase (glutamine-hydrolysing)
MFRYVAALWQPAGRGQINIVRQSLQALVNLNGCWRTALNLPGLVVHCFHDVHVKDDIIPVDGGRAVILGTLFESGSASGADGRHRRVQSLTAADAMRLNATSGRSLISSHWGSYVLFQRDPLNDKSYVLRGPSSQLPCFHTTVLGVEIFFSCVRDLLLLNLITPSINFPCIRAQAAKGDYLTAETAINEIDTLLPGEAFSLTNTAVGRNFYWSPQILSRGESVATRADAVSLVDSRTRQCVNAWSSMHDNLLVLLSGGFDSSVVLGCLTQAPHRPNVVAVNFFDRAAADERSFARSMARRAGIDLVEREFATDVDLKRFLECELTASPALHMTAFDSEPACIRLADQHRATAIFSGELGDEIFGRVAGPDFLADCMWRHGYGLALLRAAAEYAQFKRLSVWKALALGFHYRRFLAAEPYWSIYRHQKEFTDIGKGPRLVTAEALADYERTQSKFIHPWLRDVAGVPPAWVQFIQALLVTTSTWMHTAFSGDRDSLFVHPLASQPLIEAYARIPAQLHISGGHSGAVARLAFGNILSQEVRERGRSKGTPAMWLIDTVNKNRPFLREFLLEGILVKERILDRGKVEAMLSPAIGRSKISVAEIYIQLYIETWLQRWAAFRTSPSQLSGDAVTAGS